MADNAYLEAPGPLRDRTSDARAVGGLEPSHLAAARAALEAPCADSDRPTGCPTAESVFALKGGGAAYCEQYRAVTRNPRGVRHRGTMFDRGEG